MPPCGFAGRRLAGLLPDARLVEIPDSYTVKGPIQVRSHSTGQCRDSHHRISIPDRVGWNKGMIETLRTRGSGNFLTHFIMTVVGAAIAVGFLLAFYNPTPGGSGASPPGSGAVPAPAPSSAPLARGEQGIVTKVQPGLVLINAVLQYNSEQAAGTGMVINADGLVLTNNHVIEDSTSLTATVVSTGKTYPATVVGYDKTGDVALIQLQNASGLRTVPIGNSSSARTGQAVVALGNAEGQGSITAVPGQITALNQTITASDEGGSVASETLHGMIQTDADIVPGDSGGPLASPAGVIGMDTAGNDATDQQPATGFAIPINTALSVARQIASGHATSTVAIGYPPFMGIFVGSGSSSSPQAQAQQSGGGGSGSVQSCYTSNADVTLPQVIAPVATGTLIDGTICGSPAASAGMTGGAVITAVNGQAVGSPDDLNAILSQYHPGQVISVTWVSPSGQRRTSSLHLITGPPQ
jgi:S1-C subfamily serine protease